MGFAENLRFVVKLKVCGKTENNDKGAVAIEMTCNSDITSDAIAISHRRKGSEE